MMNLSFFVELAISLLLNMAEMKENIFRERSNILVQCEQIIVKYYNTLLKYLQYNV